MQGNNYARSYDSLAALEEAVLEGVKPEWIAREEVVEAIHNTLSSLYSNAATNGRDFLPEPDLILAPFKLLSPRDVRVVIVGQDPYPNRDDACGIAFQSFNPRRVPDSAVAIGGLLRKYNHIAPAAVISADYRPWIRQGVLLLNSSLTLMEHEPGSHSGVWTRAVRELAYAIPAKTVAVFLGRSARDIMGDFRSSAKLEHSHPNSHDGSFMTKDLFRLINDRMAGLKLTPIDWTLG